MTTKNIAGKKPTPDSQLTTQSKPAAEMTAEAEVDKEERLFELAQRKANVYSQSTLVPKEYQGNVGNVLIAQNMANRMGADPLQVMQNLYIVHGKPGWSAVFLIATFNACGRFSAIRYEFSGERGLPEWGCVAYCTENESGEVLKGTKVTLEMAKSEGWSTKAGSKWRTMPEQMLRYRSATFMIRTIAPEIGMGLSTRDELYDMGDDRETKPPLRGTAGIEARIQALDAPEPAPLPEAGIDKPELREPSAPLSEDQSGEYDDTADDETRNGER
jgi:hypothetical protein